MWCMTGMYLSIASGTVFTPWYLTKTRSYDYREPKSFWFLLETQAGSFPCPRVHSSLNNFSWWLVLTGKYTRPKAGGIHAKIADLTVLNRLLMQETSWFACSTYPCAPIFIFQLQKNEEGFWTFQGGAMESYCPTYGPLSDQKALPFILPSIFKMMKGC